jgi:hypothetical protein
VDKPLGKPVLTEGIMGKSVGIVGMIGGVALGILSFADAALAEGSTAQSRTNKISQTKELSYADVLTGKLCAVLAQEDAGLVKTNKGSKIDKPKAVRTAMALRLGCAKPTLGQAKHKTDAPDHSK